MRLDTEFIRLPLAIDAERLRAEVAASPRTTGGRTREDIRATRRCR